MDYTLAITILRVQNLEQERCFYHEALGFPIDEANSEPNFIMLKTAGPAWLALEDVSGQASKAAPAGGVEIGLVVDNVDQVWQELKTKGVNLLTEPQDMPFGRSFEARDPEGHCLTIYKPSRR
ncbi:MAG TPA: VOC family protein [Anaerolineae bacterium]|nr:VOC family protein [Anaerolineae bacterium]